MEQVTSSSQQFRAASSSSSSFEVNVCHCHQRGSGVKIPENVHAMYKNRLKDQKTKKEGGSFHNKKEAYTASDARKADRR